MPTVDFEKYPSSVQGGSSSNCLNVMRARVREIRLERQGSVTASTSLVHNCKESIGGLSRGLVRYTSHHARRKGPVSLKALNTETAREAVSSKI